MPASAPRFQPLTILALTLAASPATALANPLTDLGSSTRQRLEAERNTGLQDPAYERPVFSVENGAVQLRQTLSSEEQNKVRSKRYPLSRRDGTHYEAGFSAQDFWGVGNAWFGASMHFSVQGERTGDTYSYAAFDGNILGNTTTIVGSSLTTTRDYGSAATVSDDKLKYRADQVYLGHKTQIAQGTLPLGHRFEPDHVVSAAVRIFEQTYRFSIGPVPIRVTAGLGGNLSTGRPFAEFGPAPSDITEIRYKARGEAWGSLRAYVEASILGDIPADVRPGDVKPWANVDLFRGSLKAGLDGSSADAGPCMDARLNELTVMNANVGLHVWWSFLRTFYVRGFVEMICDGVSWLPGCREVKEFLERVDEWTRFDYREELYNHRGFTFASDWVWLERRSCDQRVTPTTLELCSDNDQDIYAAVGRHNRGTDKWDSHGWWRVPANGCATVDLGNYTARDVYVFAEHQSSQTTWGTGGAQFCVHKTERFEMPGADTATCPGATHKRVVTSRVAVTPNTKTRHNFNRADLTPRNSKLRFCNQHTQTLWAAYGHDRAGSVRTNGWFEVAPGGCMEQSLGDYQGSAWVYATSGDLRWGQGDWLCVDDHSAFDVANARGACNQSSDSAYREFTRVDIPRGQTVTWNAYTNGARRTRSVCNYASEAVGVAWAVTPVHPVVDATRLGGWTTVEQNKCRVIALKSSADDVWLMALSATRRWSGDATTGSRMMCVNLASGFGYTLDDPTSCPAGGQLQAFGYANQESWVLTDQNGRPR